MFTNLHEIIIGSNIETVWNVLTSSEQLSEYVKNIKVVSDWRQSSDFICTHYQKNGTVTEWKGMKMIWNGVIKVLKINEQLEISYQDYSTGLIKKSYIWNKFEESKTKVIFTQFTTNEEVAKNYKEGNEYVLDALKEYCEK